MKLIIESDVVQFLNTIHRNRVEISRILKICIISENSIFEKNSFPNFLLKSLVLNKLFPKTLILERILREKKWMLSKRRSRNSVSKNLAFWDEIFENLLFVIKKIRDFFRETIFSKIKFFWLIFGEKKVCWEKSFPGETYGIHQNNPE